MAVRCILLFGLKPEGLTAGFIISFVSGNLLYITSSEGIIELFDMGD